MVKLAVVAVASLLVAGCTGMEANVSYPSTTTTPGGSAEDQGAAARDVAPPSCSNDRRGLAAGTVTVTNSSSQRSDYVITVVLEPAEGGPKIRSTTTSVDGLEPGQTGSGELRFTKAMPAGTTCRVTEVQRTASP